eukprot:TRINITY_DN11802_c0_g6_i1.p1 TRINITY_DN11802_c0_g6~~TRINITY_DN11802_c0_g6_i1.p1  ORF type:complete len:112 (+),score=13.21 TRINITY_DN11802_c0_g6_i1:232-567(+)
MGEHVNIYNYAQIIELIEMLLDSGLELPLQLSNPCLERSDLLAPPVVGVQCVRLSQIRVHHVVVKDLVRPLTDLSRVPVSYTHLRAHETPEHLVCRLLLEKKKKTITISYR